MKNQQTNDGRPIEDAKTISLYELENPHGPLYIAKESDGSFWIDWRLYDNDSFPQGSIRAAEYRFNSKKVIVVPVEVYLQGFPHEKDAIDEYCRNLEALENLPLETAEA
jgi:hypothetical protein